MAPRGRCPKYARRQNPKSTAAKPHVQLSRQAEQKALRHHAAHRAAAVRRNGCRNHARHGQADAGSGKRDGEQEHGEDELIKPHALRADLARQIRTIADVRNAEKQ